MKPKTPSVFHLTIHCGLSTIKPREEVAFITATEIAKRRRAEKTAYAINSIEGVPVSKETKRLSSQWANGELTIEQIKAELVKKYKAKTT